MKQTISKITLITSLLFTNVVKSQEFYTCVPKEDWVKNVSKSSQRSDEEIRNLARQVKRSDEEIRNLARQVRRSDSEIDSIASKYGVSDSHIINLIKNNTPKSALEICLENKKNCERDKQNKINEFDECVSNKAGCNSAAPYCVLKRDKAFEECREELGNPNSINCGSCF